MRDHFGDFDDVLFLHQFRRDVQSSFSYLELSVNSPDTAKRTVHYIFNGSKKGLIAIFESTELFVHHQEKQYFS